MGVEERGEGPWWRQWSGWLPTPGHLVFEIIIGSIVLKFTDWAFKNLWDTQVVKWIGGIAIAFAVLLAFARAQFEFANEIGIRSWAAKAISAVCGPAVLYLFCGNLYQRFVLPPPIWLPDWLAAMGDAAFWACPFFSWRAMGWGYLVYALVSGLFGLVIGYYEADSGPDKV